MEKYVNAVEVCGVRQRSQSRVEGVETVPSATPILQSEFQQASKDDLREGVLGVLQNIVG